jgi:hypothetical protein
MMATRQEILQQISDELSCAQYNYPKLSTCHDGYGRMLEEVDELWDAIKKHKFNCGTPAMRAECIQIAAMALRFIEELC